MCPWGTDQAIHVIHRNHPDIQDGWHTVYVDACIADYVQTMNDQGIITVGCCCSHGHQEPTVLVDVESVALLEDFGYDYTGFDDRTDIVTHAIPMSGIAPEWQLYTQGDPADG